MRFLASSVVEEIVSIARKCIYYSIIFDGATDTTRREQMSLCIRYVTDDFMRDFLATGMYQARTLVHFMP